MALRVTVAFQHKDFSTCSEIVGVNMGHAIMADKDLTSVKCEACEVAARDGAVVVGGRICNGRAEVVLVASPYQLGRILRELYELGLQPRVLGRAKFIKEPALTEDQLRLLELAYKLGLFDDNRKVTVKELADILGISPSAADRKLRRALKNVVKYYLSRYGRGEF